MAVPAEASAVPQGMDCGAAMGNKVAVAAAQATSAAGRAATKRSA